MFPNKPTMKKLIYLFLLISFFSFSQEKITVIDFTSGNYPVGEKVKILYDKDWRPVTAIDSADYYRVVKFKEKNIPSGLIRDYKLNDTKQNFFLRFTQYGNYLGLDVTGVDSIYHNGPVKVFDKNGNLSIQETYVNNQIEGDQLYYYEESGEIKMRSNFIDGKQEGITYYYYESGGKMVELEYSNGVINADRRYDKLGSLESITPYVNGLRQGLAKGYKKGILTYTANYDNDFINGDQVFYYESGIIRGKISYVNSIKTGPEISYYETGEKNTARNYKNDKLEGIGLSYYITGELECQENRSNDKLDGKEICYYKSGEKYSLVNYINDLKQGLKTYFLKNGEVDYDELYLDDRRVDRKIALVIGNAAYKKGPLENPVNDANLIAESLEKLDFEVELYNNLSSRDEMLDAIKDFGRKRKNYEVAFVYYAGHGIQLNNENYLLPVNEEFEFEDDVEDNGVSMQRVLRYLESTRENQLNFIVLDACRDNPFESNWNKTRSLKGAGLAKTPPPTGSLIAFSTDHGQTAADGDGGNSLYSQALAEKLLEENVSIEQVFKNVRTEVLKLSGDTQSPVEESKLTGDVFYLNKK